MLLLQNLEMFNSNIGLHNEWYLPTEPSIIQLFASDSGLNTHSAQSSILQPEVYPSGPDSSLCRLPAEREAIGKTSFSVFELHQTNYHLQRSSAS